jgi:hypothetical protein
MRRVTKAMDWLRRVGHSRWLDAGAALVALFSGVHIAMLVPGRARHYDFAHYYVARQLLTGSPNPYTASLGQLYAEHGLVADDPSLRLTDPPTMLWLFAPLESLPVDAAFRVWVCLEVASLVVVLWLTRRLLEGRLSARGWLFVCAGTLASEALRYHFYYSQIQLLLAALLLAAYACRQRGKHWAACLAVTVAGLVKIFPFVLLPWFVWRSEGGVKARLGKAITVIAVIAVCIWLTGWSRWLGFSQDAMPVIADTAKRSLGQFSIASLAAKFGGRMQTVGSLAGLALVAASYGRCAWSGGDREAEFCLLSVAMLMGGLAVWPHYFVLLIFPMAVAAVSVRARQSLPWVVLYALVVLWLNEVDTTTTVLLHRHPGPEALVNYWPLYGMLALWCLFMMDLREPMRPNAG